MARNMRSNSSSQKSGSGRYDNKNKSSRNYGKKSSKSKFERTDTKETDFKAPGGNDPAWYSASQSLLRDSANIPYSWALGTPVQLNYGTLASSVTNNFGQPHITIPGIQTISLVPSVGYSFAPTDPVNVAANATYSFIRHANAGHANYDAPDLMLYIMSMSQVYSYICFLQRLYGVCTLYSQRNRYLPDALLKSMGVDPSVVKDLANLRYGINVLINKAASFAVPADMTYFARQAFMYQNVYTEGSSPKDQLYMYIPYGFWQFNYNATDSAGELIMKNFTSMDGASVNALLAFGTSLLNVLIQDEDMNIMSGDILKAYGSDKIVKLQPLTTEFPIVPIYNLEVLEQMKNATIAGHPAFNTFDYSVKQNSTHAYLISTPKVSTLDGRSGTAWIADAYRKALSIIGCNKLLTTQNPDVTPEITMENTRLACTVKGFSYNPGTASYATLASGSEIAVACTHWYYRVVTDAITGLDTLTLGSVGFETAKVYPAVSDAIGLIECLAIPRHFKFAPLMHVVTYQQDATVNTTAKFVSAYLNFDVDNYGVVDAQDLQRMHEAALLNELHVPLIGKISL